MCGIVGIVESDLSRPVAARRARTRMVRTLHHRGPDDEGSVTLAGVGLGMRRLSIVDLAGGQQPFSNETDDDPARRQRRDLQLSRSCAQELAGARPRVPQPLRHRGAGPRLRGVGRRLPDAPARDVRAGALGRRARARCLRRAIARARSRSTGRRRRAGCCSRPRSRRCWSGPEVTRELDPEAVDQFLTYEYVIAPRTILKGVHKLPAGHYLHVSRRRGHGAPLLGRGRVRVRAPGRTTRPRRRCARRCGARRSAR